MIRQWRFRASLLLLLAGLLLPGLGGAQLALAKAPGQGGAAARSEIFYQVFVRSFRDSNGDRIGDLDGLRQGLGYIKRLGVTTILLTPVQPSPFYHSYFATDFEGVAAEYGGKQAWLAFLRAAHAQGLKVYMDLEFQYVAGGHQWLSSAWHNPASPYRDWLFWNEPPGGGADGARNADPLASVFGLYAGSADGSSHVITPVNLENPATRAYFRDYLLRWADPHGDGSGRDGVDGYRIDHMMDDLDNMHRVTNLFDGFWTPLIAAVKARRPGFRFVGEQWDWGYGTDFLDRGHADMVFAFPLRDALNRLEKPAIVQQIEATERATPAGKRQVIFLENHDTDRFMTLLDGDMAKARAGAAIALMLKGEPLIYYGQELGMRGMKGPSESTDAPDIGRREAFRWQADLAAPESAIWYRALDRVWNRRSNRSQDGVSVAEQRPQGSLLNWYRQLIGLRRSRPELSSGDQSLPCAPASPVLCVLRQQGGKRTLLLVNLSAAPAAPVLDAHVQTRGLRRLAGTGALRAPLAPYAVRIAGTP
ncbi:MAG: alpha-amylase family glycosyl hydrolase [Sphingomonadales bacterium]|jgi:glycosidase